MQPMFRRKVVEGEELVRVPPEGLDSLRILRLVLLGELVHQDLRPFLRLRLHDLVQGSLGPRLETLRELVEDVDQAAHPASLLPRFWKDVPDRGPESQRSVPDPHHRIAPPSLLQSTTHGPPALGASSLPIL